MLLRAGERLRDVESPNITIDLVELLQFQWLPYSAMQCFAATTNYLQAATTNFDRGKLEHALQRSNSCDAWKMGPRLNSNI